jgi:hypothetical protein
MQPPIEIQVAASIQPQQIRQAVHLTFWYWNTMACSTLDLYHFQPLHLRCCRVPLRHDYITPVLSYYEGSIWKITAFAAIASTLPDLFPGFEPLRSPVQWT